MAENLTSQFGYGWDGNNDNAPSMGSGFGCGCNGSFFETLIMLIIIIWLLRWLFSCGIFNCGNNGFGGCGAGV